MALGVVKVLSIMRIEELSIGNWVQLEMGDMRLSRPLRVLSIDIDGIQLGLSDGKVLMPAFIHELHPIRLTMELIERYGKVVDEHSMMLGYVHELQNFMCLLGIEEDIEL